VARDLDHRKTYTIEIIFAEDPDDFEVKAQIECLIATMDVKIATSQSEFACLKEENADTIQQKVNSQPITMILSYKTLTDKAKHLSMVSANDRRNKVKAPKFVIEIVDEGTDLEVTIEGSDHLYGSTIQIIPEDHAGVDLE
jgi:hypothetical protein